MNKQKINKPCTTQIDNIKPYSPEYYFRPTLKTPNTLPFNIPERKIVAYKGYQNYKKYPPNLSDL